MKRFWFLLALVWSSAAVAQNTDCYQWRQGSSGTWYDSPQEAADGFASGYNDGGSATSNGVWDSQASGLASATFPSFTWLHSYKTTGLCPSCVVTQTTNFSRTLSSRISPAGCPVCPASGEQRSIAGDGSVSGAPARACLAGCRFQKCGVGVSSGSPATYLQTYCSEGYACAASATGGLTDKKSESDCDSTGKICKDDGGGGSKNCGVYNGDRVCVGSTPPGGCVEYASGGVACKGGAGGGAPASPPAPDNGTPGTPATPDAVVTHSDGTTVNYYGGGTVAGSSASPGTSSAAPDGGNRPITSGSGGGSSGSGSGGGEPSPCVGGDCDAGVPTLDDIGTLGEAFGSFWSELQAVPLVDATNDIGISFGSGACPNWSDSISYAGETWDIDFSSICTLWADISSVISVVMLVFFGFVAFRVLFSA